MSEEMPLYNVERALDDMCFYRENGLHTVFTVDRYGGVNAFYAGGWCGYKGDMPFWDTRRDGDPDRAALEDAALGKVFESWGLSAGDGDGAGGRGEQAAPEAQRPARRPHKGRR